MQHEHVARVVNEELPFLALEKAMMWLTEEGADRQVAHERIREVALAAKEAQKIAPVSIESILADSFFDKVIVYVRWGCAWRLYSYWVLLLEPNLRCGFT